MSTWMETGAPRWRRSSSVRPWRRAFAGWLAMAVAATLNGIARETALVPRLGPRAAGQVSVLTGVTLLQLIARQVFRGQRLPLRHLAAVAVVWLLMTVGFEFTIGRAQQKSWRELLDAYKLAEDRLWPLVLTSVVAAPFFWGRRLER